MMLSGESYYWLMKGGTYGAGCREIISVRTWMCVVCGGGTEYPELVLRGAQWR